MTVPDGCSPLWYSTCYSNTETVRLLLARGADIEAKNINGETPLLGSDFGVTKVLLEHGAKVDEKDNNGWTALNYASARSVNIRPNDDKNVELLRKWREQKEVRQ